MSRRRVVVSAGGTGGHFYPGLVLAQTLAQRGWQPLMLVRTDDPALPRLEALGIPAADVQAARGRGGDRERRMARRWASARWGGQPNHPPPYFPPEPYIRFYIQILVS